MNEILILTFRVFHKKVGKLRRIIENTKILPHKDLVEPVFFWFGCFRHFKCHNED